MITKTRKYTTKLTPDQIKEILRDHKEPFYKFSINNRYETSVHDGGFKIKSMPASRRGIYRETHVGKVCTNGGLTEVEITSQLHKAGPFVVLGLFVLFLGGMLFTIFANANGQERFADSKMVLMIVFMLVMHVVFYIIFIQLFAWIAKKWIENTLDLEKA